MISGAKAVGDIPIALAKTNVSFLAIDCDSQSFLGIKTGKVLIV
jgi:hypothetical protein